MTNPVKISFEVEGVQQLKSVFESVEQRLLRFDRNATQSTQRGARERVAAVKREASDREKEFSKLARQADKWQRDEVRAVERASKEKERVESALARRREGIRETSMRMSHRLLEQEVRDEERAARQKERIATQSARRASAVQRQYNERVLGRAGGAISGAVGVGTRLIGAGMALGGGFAVADAMRREMGFDRAVAQASNAAFIPGQTTRQQVNVGRVAAMSKSVQALTGIDKTDAANAIKRYVGLSSDFEGLAAKNKGTGRTNLEELGIISKASGTDFNQLIEAAAAVKAGNPEMAPEQLMTTMRGLIGAGKKGTLPLDLLAAHVGEIQASASIYAGGQTAGGLAANQNKLLGLTQLVGKATGGDPAEAATAVKDLGAQVAKNGVKRGMTASMIYEGGDARKGFVDPSEMIANIFQSTGGRYDVAQKMLGQRAVKVFEALNPTYQAAEARQKGSGVAAVRGQVKEFESVGYSADDTMKDFSQVMSTSGERIDLAFQRISEVVEEHAAPVLERFAKTLEEHEGDIEKAISALGELADFMLNHPWTSLAVALEVNIVKSIVAAKIGDAVKSALLGMMSGGGGGVPTAAGKGGLLLPTLSGVFALTTLMATADSASTGEEAGRKFGYEAPGLLAQTAKDLKSGKISPGQAAEVYNKINDRYTEAYEGSGGKGAALDIVATPGQLIPGVLGESARAQVAKYHADMAITGAGQWGGNDGSGQRLVDALVSLRVEIEKAGTAKPGAPGVPDYMTHPNAYRGGPSDPGHPSRSGTLAEPSRGGISH